MSGVSLSDVGLHGFFLQGLEANDVLFFRFDLTSVTYCKYKIHTNHCRVPDKEWSFQDGGL